MNGARIILRRDGVIFLRLPTELQRPIDGCRCPYCVAHPNEPPMWDTLAITAEPPGTRETPDYAWTVHMPEVRP